jgi:hypothetical protein
MGGKDPDSECKLAFVHAVFASALHVSGQHIKITTCAFIVFLATNSVGTPSLMMEYGQLAAGRSVSAHAHKRSIHTILLDS